MRAASQQAHQPALSQGRHAMLLAAVVAVFAVAAILAFTAYAMLRPFTHLRYRHSSDHLWRPLD